MGLKKKQLQFEQEILSDIESEPDIPRRLQSFPFFELPSEIRLRIYHFLLFTPARKSALQRTGNVGASAKKSKPLSPSSQRVALFLVSQKVHDEATHYFYSTQTFRVFPVQDFLKMPTLRALPRRHRPSITTIELIVGSSWTAPPRNWIVNQGLGLHDMALARTLKVFVQCDPSHPVFEGFRISENFYTDFCGDLLQKILERLPGLVQVEFDAWPSVEKNGPLMTRLLAETRHAQKKVLWGPDRGWTDWDGHHNKDRHKKYVNNDADAAFDGLRAHPPDAIEGLAKSLKTVTLES